MRILSILVFFTLFFGCNNITPNGKGRSSIIVKDGSFVYTELSVRSLSTSEIYADISFRNNSENSVLFYKILLPLDGKLKTDIFSIFDSETFDQIIYTGTRAGHYLKTAPDDDEGEVIPNLTPGNFIILPPHQNLSCTVNLSRFYDFSEVKKGTKLSLAYAIFLPAVSLDYKQLYEIDSVDNKMKPVYYDLTLPKKQDIDSMRVKFYF